MPVQIVDLFCGIGGLTRGLINSGLNVIAGFDIDPTCQYTYEHSNHISYNIRNIRDIDGNQINNLYSDDATKILVGCAPCQPFSQLRSKYGEANTLDEKYDLLLEYGRIIREVHPQVLSMENVPQIENTRIFREFLNILDENGYEKDYHVIYCPDYGIPQTRRRFVLVASILGPISLIEPTHNRKDIHVRDFIGNLPPIAAGEFLYVGHRKRENSLVSPVYNRPYMGRKGIGKLSMFSISQEIDVYSRKMLDDKNSEFNALRMDSEKIESSIKGEGDFNQSTAYYPEVLEIDDSCLAHSGTKIVLKKLKKNTSSLTVEYIKKRVARRFGIIGVENNFRVFVNNNEVTITDRDYFRKLRYIWYYGKESEKYSGFCSNLSYNECRDNVITINNKQYTISGWIGSVDASGDLKDGNDNLRQHRTINAPLP